MSIALFSVNVFLIISISLVLIGSFLFNYSKLPSAEAISSSIQLLSVSISPQQQHQQLLPINNNNVSNSLSNTINGTTIFNLQSIFLNSLFKQVQNSIVEITASSSISSSSIPPFSPSDPNEVQNKSSLGSGFVYDTKGHIITNYHVVANAKTVDVTFTDGNKYTASVIGKDPAGDLAVLKIMENISKPLIPLQIVNSSSLKIGDLVVAIGNPYGLDNTMTTGIVSQTGHIIQESSNTLITDAVQTDAPINPGNSGGPLLNIKGQVVGVNTAAESIGVYFAISSNTLLKEIPILMEKGNFTHSYLGIKGTTFTSDLASQFNNISKTLRGVYVDTIAKDGPGDKAGIQGATIDYYGQKHGGDIITAINKQNITKMDQLITYVDQHIKPQDTLTLTVFRDGHFIDLKATASERPTPSPSVK